MYLLCIHSQCSITDIGDMKIILHSYDIIQLDYLSEHEEKQNKLRALRNRQDLFQEEVSGSTFV